MKEGKGSLLSPIGNVGFTAVKRSAARPPQPVFCMRGSAPASAKKADGFVIAVHHWLCWSMWEKRWSGMVPSDELVTPAAMRSLAVWIFVGRTRVPTLKTMARLFFPSGLRVVLGPLAVVAPL